MNQCSLAALPEPWLSFSGTVALLYRNGGPIWSGIFNINHFSVLAKKFPSSESSARREILLAANKNSAFDWLREQKESFLNMDSWQKAAYIYSISGLPKDDKKYFINRQKFTRPFEKALAKWSKNLIL